MKRIITLIALILTLSTFSYAESCGSSCSKSNAEKVECQQDKDEEMKNSQDSADNTSQDSAENT